MERLRVPNGTGKAIKVQKEYDLIVIGSGPAGQKGAVQATKLKKSVAIIEIAANPGGVCLYTGTLPSKTLRETVTYYQGFRKRSLKGISCSLDKATTLLDLMNRVDAVIREKQSIISDQLSRNEVQIIRGRARFSEPHEVCVDHSGTQTRLRAEYFLIATGSKPIHLPHIPRLEPPVFDSDTILKINHIPKTLTVLGGGVVGCEYACMFAILGAKVTIVDRRKTLLRFMDEEITAALIYFMRNIGITLRLGEDVESIEVPSMDHAVTTLRSGKKIQTMAILSATGRKPETEHLNLEKAGVVLTSSGLIEVNESYQTKVSHIYAAGDVIGFPSLASASMDQGRMAACRMFGCSATAFPDLLPYGVYTIPEISMVGESEESLTEKSIPYETGVAHFREIARGQIIGETEGLLKLIFHNETFKLLGVHIIGEGATELVHIGQAVMAHDGSIEYFVSSVFNYPTLAEAYKVAALNGVNKIRTHINDDLA